MPGAPANKLYFGDNLDVLREKIRDESVDLVYLDPPFQSSANYNVLFKPGGQVSQAQAEAFRDTWEWGDAAQEAYEDVIRMNGDVALVLSGFRRWLGEDNAMMAYLAMMTARLIELRRVLKPDGSLYLHCDPTASHYLKIILDALFGHESFRNEIAWKRTFAHGGAKRWGDVHDTILFYTRGDKYTWTRPLQAHAEDYLGGKYRFSDERGRYRFVVLTGPGISHGASGAPWRGYNPTKAGRHWAVPKRAIAALQEAGVVIPSDLHEQLELLFQKGFIRFPEKKDGTPGVPEFKLHLPKGQPIQDMILDIPPINSQARERLHYPTQKPVALLKRIIDASSHEGDVILDPFCGCGTTIEAAEAANRHWLGIDVTHYAITLVERRMAGMGDAKEKYEVVGRPTDIAGARDLAKRDKHQFQWWAAWRLGARWYREERKGADRGIDGRMMFRNGPYGDGLIIISVKGGENIGVKDVRDLRGVIERERAEMGVIITLEDPTGPMKTEAVSAGYVSKSAHGRLPRLQVVTVGDILDGRMPKFPPLPQVERAIKRAPRAADRGQLELLLPFAGDRVIPAKGDFIDPSIMVMG